MPKKLRSHTLLAVEKGTLDRSETILAMPRLNLLKQRLSVRYILFVVLKELPWNDELEFFRLVADFVIVTYARQLEVRALIVEGRLAMDLLFCQGLHDDQLLIGFRKLFLKRSHSLLSKLQMASYSLLLII